MIESVSVISGGTPHGTGATSMSAMQNESSSSAPQQKRPFQFRLKDVLLGMAWLAGLLAIFVNLASGEGTPLFVVAWCAVPLVVANRRGLMSVAEAAVVWGIICVIVALLIPVYPSAREAGRRSQCLNNVHQISLALSMYEQKYGCLPPAYIADANGKPMHSWRVLILPFTEQQALYSRYNFSEPWDGPNNKKLHSISMPVLCCPSNDQNPNGISYTNYVAVIGPGTAWPGAASTTYDMVRDGLSNTILLVEVANSGIHWMEPRDLPASAVSAGINPTGAAAGTAISSEHPGGVIVAFMDGRCMFLSETMPPDALNALFTIRGGELLSDDGGDFTLVAPQAKPQAAR